MKDSLTPQEEALIPHVVAEWVGQLSAPMQEDKVPEKVAWLYRLIGLPTPRIVICDSPRAMLDYCKKELKDDSPETLSYGNASDFGWVAYYDFFDRIGIEVTDEYKQYREYAKVGIFDAVAYEEVFVCCRNPVEVHRNAEGVPHNERGPSARWVDGYAVYHLNGRHIDRNWAEKCLSREITPEEFAKEPNDELRAAAFAYLGNDFATMMGAREVDSQDIVHGNGEVETLWLIKTKKKLNTVKNKPYAWLKRICPSTGTVYMTPTDPDFKTALEAAKFHRPDFVPQELDYRWVSRS
jgi:hypothetical protein